MTAQSSARWRPPNGRRSLSFYRWTSWARVVLMAVVAAMIIGNLIGGGSVVGAVFALFVVAFLGSTAIWRLQCIHAIERERRGLRQNG